MQAVEVKQLSTQLTNALKSASQKSLEMTDIQREHSSKVAELEKEGLRVHAEAQSALLEVTSQHQTEIDTAAQQVRGVDRRSRVDLGFRV